jgi:uncharacterized protein YecE (DUF72 family)
MKIKTNQSISKIVLESARSLTKYLIGTGGWAYFKVPGQSSLRAYSRIFDFVEVNYTFYKYSDTRMVEHWRRTVPSDFTFTVRCHQDLTHRIGFKPVQEAYTVFSRMIGVCRVLKAPFLHLETPVRYTFDEQKVREAREFFSNVDQRGVGLAWEIRGEVTEEIAKLMQDFDIVHSVDLSREAPAFRSDVVYTRLFGKGKHNIYQFTDEELEEIDQKTVKSKARIAVATFHGLKMNTDAARFKAYKEKGVFLPVTSFTGVDSARAVLSEDTQFPSTKAELIEHQGWKVIDLEADKRIHLSELLSKLPEKTYHSVEEIIQELEVHA